MKIIIAGGAGFIGQHIVRFMTEIGHSVVILTRNPRPEHETALTTANYWNGETLGPWTNHIESANIIINLSGENIFDKPWTKNRKQTLLTSRIHTTQTLINAIKRHQNPNLLFINASAVGYYDLNGQETATESSSKGKGFLAEVCTQWEDAAKEALTCCKRVVFLRTGAVLGKRGGVLKKLVPLFKMYLGGHPGNGQQWFPWIHIDEIPQILTHIIKTDSLSGPINLTAPTGIRMGSFCALLGKSLGKPSWLHTPAFILKLVLGERAGMVLRGQKIIPKKLLSSGYVFKYNKASTAIDSLIGDNNLGLNNSV